MLYDLQNFEGRSQSRNISVKVRTEGYKVSSPGLNLPLPSPPQMVDGKIQANINHNCKWEVSPPQYPEISLQE